MKKGFNAWQVISDPGHECDFLFAANGFKSANVLPRVFLHLLPNLIEKGREPMQLGRLQYRSVCFFLFIDPSHHRGYKREGELLYFRWGVGLRDQLSNALHSGQIRFFVEFEYTIFLCSRSLIIIIIIISI